MSSLPLGLPFPLCPSALTQSYVYRLLRVQDGWGRDREGHLSSQGWKVAQSWNRGGIGSCTVLGLLFGAILLFLVSKAICSPVHCFNSSQEISPCSGSAVPLVPGGATQVEVYCFVSGLKFHHQDHHLPFSECCPPCLHGTGKDEEEKSPVNLLFFVAIVVNYIYFYVKRRMLKSAFQHKNTVPSERTHAIDVILMFLVATLKYMKLMLICN